MEIILGHFLSHEVTMPLAGCAPGRQQYARVIKTEEKGSDVNLAAHVIHDGHEGLYQVAILITNDSDLAEPVKIIRNELHLPVGVLNPIPARPSHELQKLATFVKPIRRGAIAASQFPDVLTDSIGTFHKPATW
jgi:hypothetical protein